MLRTKLARSGGSLIAAAVAFALVSPATSAWAGHARSLYFDGDNNPIGEVGPGFGDFPDFPEPAVGPFPDTEGMEWRGQLVPEEIHAITQRAGVLLNDIWGWTSPRGEDYALVGTSDGLSIVRVTDPDNPQFIGQVVGPDADPDGFGNLWGDAGVYNVWHSRDDDDDDDEESYTGYVYYTTEADGVGINIVELNRLDDMPPAPDNSVKISTDGFFEKGGYDSSHNIYVNQKSGFAYVAGVNLVGDETACDDDPNHPSRFNTMILDLKSNPLDPDIVACLADRGEHDFYVVNYNGPDRDYRGREIAFVFDGRDLDAAGRNGQRKDNTLGDPVSGGTEIWDVTDKNNIKIISTIYPENLCFSHAGWTSSDRHEFLMINDEIDEPRDAEPKDGTGFFRTAFCRSDEPQDPSPNPRLYIVNIKDLDNPVVQGRYFVEGDAAENTNDHNFVRDGDKLYWALYNGGTRVLEIKTKRNKLLLKDIARMDTEPRDVQPPFFNGQWGVFSFREGETIVAADIVNGLIVSSLTDDDDDDDDDDDVKVASRDDDDD